MKRMAFSSGPKHLRSRGSARMPSHFESGSTFQATFMLRCSSLALMSCSTSNTSRLFSASNLVMRTWTICVASPTKSRSGEVALMTPRTSVAHKASTTIIARKQRANAVIECSAAYDEPVTVSYRTADGTATTSDGDYVAKSGTLTFLPGETTKTITIEVKGDSKKEADLTFSLELYGVSTNALFLDAIGLGTILNDD